MTRRPTTAAVLGTLTLLAFAACQSGSRDAARDTAAVATDSAAPGTSSAAAPGTAAGAPDSASNAASLSQGAMLDPNAASREQLLAVPGMNAAAADALIAGRPYDNMVAVNRVLSQHVGDADRKTVYARVWKPIDLNTASGDEILLIPGVGARMRHEFEEYRPYKNIERFRREIGKYVDKNEVARLERYVTIR